MKLVRSCIALLACAWVSSFSAPARAQESAPRSAEALFEAGLAAAKRGELEQAADLFVRSEALERSPNTLLNLAIAYGRLNRPLDALSTLDTLDELLRADADEERRSKAAKLRARAEAQIAIVDLALTPAVARVSIDGARVIKGARLSPGHHLVRAEADGYEPAEWSVELSAGQRARIERSLAPASAPQVVSAVLPAVSDPGSEERAEPMPARAPVSSDTEGRDEPASKRHKRWKLALIVGSAVVAAAAGTALVVALTRPDKTATPAGETAF